MQPSIHTFDVPAHNEVLIGIWTHGHDWMDSSIKFLTHGRGTHAAFIRGNGNIIENFYPRVRERGWNAGERRKVEEYRIAGSTPADWAALETWFDHQLKHPPAYSILDLLRYAVNLPPVHGGSCFCSMWVLRGIRLNLAPEKQPLTRLPYPDWADPRDLRISTVLHRREKFVNKPKPMPEWPRPFVPDAYPPREHYVGCPARESKPVCNCGLR